MIRLAVLENVPFSIPLVRSIFSYGLSYSYAAFYSSSYLYSSTSGVAMGMFE